MHPRVLFALLVWCAAIAAGAAEQPSVFDPTSVGGSVGIFTDPEGTVPCATIQPGTFTTLYVVATTGGATANGITGTEFRIEVSNPTGWFLGFTPNPSFPITIGSPWDLAPDDPNNPTGVNIGFPACQPGPKVTLGTILVVDQGGLPTELRVKRRTPPANPHWPCPLFTICDSGYSKVCMEPCTTSPVGEVTTFVGSINDPKCESEPNCPADCAAAPCVSIAPVANRWACPGSPVTVTGTVTNCGTEPADLDIFIDFILAASHTAVPPGGVVTATRDVIQGACEHPNYDPNFVGVVARSASCPAEVGFESGQVVFCDDRLCDGGLPPDCSDAYVNVATLWPPDERMVPITIEGVTDPNGDPVQIQFTSVTSDEPNTWRCEDADFSPSGLSLRAARDGNRNGRVYAVSYRASDPSGLRCTGRLYVCAPRKQHESCVDDGQDYEPLHCWAPWWEPAGGITAAPVGGAGVRIKLDASPRHAGRIEIYDVRGRRVAVLDESRVPPGTTDLLWDGRDSTGRLAARGVYLIRAVVDGVRHSTKSVLLR